MSAHLRHVHTRYDELLASGHARDVARASVAADVEQVMEAWQERFDAAQS